MATRDEIQSLASMAIFDNGYRSRLLANPKAAAEELRIKLTRKEIKYIKSLDAQEIQQLAVEVQNITKTVPGALHWK